MCIKGLTNLQEVAINGEIASIISTSVHNADIKYRIYYILKEIDEELKPFFMNGFKNIVTFNDNIIDQIYLETLHGTVPVWLWIEKTIMDIKEAMRLMDTTISSTLSINKKSSKEQIIESAFVVFSRKALFISVEASEQLFDKILNDVDLDFLHTTCFYLKSCCEEVRDMGTVQDKIPEEIMKCQFDIRDVMNFVIEFKALKKISKKKRKNYTKKKPKVEKIVTTEQINITPDMTEEEMSELINKKIMEAFHGLISAPLQETTQLKYVVNKVFNNTQISTSIRTCKTRKEAEEFIKQIKEKYPELQKTCKFFISEEKENGNR